MKIYNRPLCHILSLICVLMFALSITGCGNKEVAKNKTAKHQHSSTAKKTDSKKNTSSGPNSKKATNEKNPDTSQITDINQLLNLSAGQSNNTPLALGKSAPSAQQIPAKPGAPPPANKKPTGQQLLVVLQNYYRSVKTLKANGVSSIKVTQDGKVVAQAKDSKFSVLFKLPNKFVLREPNSQLSTDGKTVYQYAPKAKRYAKTKMSKDMMRSIVMSKVGVGVMGLMTGIDYTSAMSSANLIKETELAGKPVIVLELRLKEGVGVPAGVKATQTLWIGKKDLGIYKNELLTEEHPARPKGYKGKMPKLIRTLTTSTANHFDLNTKLSDSLFAFNPPAGVKPVETPKQVDLTGKAAPDFSFKWTDGSVKNLSDFRGKAVVLDFWALPVTEKHMPIIQSFYEHNKDNVQIITVTLNSDTSKLKEYLDKKKYTFPVVYADEKIANAAVKDYKLIGVPSIFTLDKDGIIHGCIFGDTTADTMNAKLQKAIAAE